MLARNPKSEARQASGQPPAMALVLMLLLPAAAAGSGPMHGPRPAAHRPPRSDSPGQRAGSWDWRCCYEVGRPGGGDAAEVRRASAAGAGRRAGVAGGWWLRLRHAARLRVRVWVRVALRAPTPGHCFLFGA
jgi:hypothetical protein